jgi:hypothetical protein
MPEVPAEEDLEDARQELRQALHRYGAGMPVGLRSKVRRALDLVESALAKLDQTKLDQAKLDPAKLDQAKLDPADPRRGRGKPGGRTPPPRRR